MLKNLTTILVLILTASTASAQSLDSDISLENPLLRFGEAAALAALAERRAQETRDEYSAICDSLNARQTTYIIAAGTDQQVDAGNALREANLACDAIKYFETEAETLLEFIHTAFTEALNSFEPDPVSKMGEAQLNASFAATKVKLQANQISAIQERLNELEAESQRWKDWCANNGSTSVCLAHTE